MQKERIEANIAKEQLTRVRSDVEARTIAIEKDVQYARELEFKKSQEVRDEVQKRFIESANDTLEYHQSNLNIIREQHKRELKILQDDIISLRQR